MWRARAAGAMQENSQHQETSNDDASMARGRVKGSLAFILSLVLFHGLLSRTVDC